MKFRFCRPIKFDEHFSKWMELVTLSNRNSEGTTYSFMERMLSRFGASIEVFIDQVMKFHGESQKALIDHQVTS